MNLTRRFFEFTFLIGWMHKQWNTGHILPHQRIG